MCIYIYYIQHIYIYYTTYIYIYIHFFQFWRHCFPNTKPKKPAASVFKPTAFNIFNVARTPALELQLLIEEIRRSPVEVGSLSHYLQGFPLFTWIVVPNYFWTGFMNPKWFRISSILSSIISSTPFTTISATKVPKGCWSTVYLHTSNWAPGHQHA